MQDESAVHRYLEQVRASNGPGPARDLIGYGRDAPGVRWPNDATLAINLVVNYEEGSETSFPAGDMSTEGLADMADREIAAKLPNYRDLHGESSFEYGSRAGIWRIFRLLAQYDIKSTFFASAIAFELNPAVAAAVSEGGHEPASHGWRWGGTQHWQMTREEEANRIRATVASFERTCGQRPLGWFCRYGVSLNTRELLVEEGGFVYDSDSYADELPYFVEVAGAQHLVVPYTLVFNDYRFAVSQGFSAPADFVDLCCRAINDLREEGRTGFPKMMSIGLHPRLIGHPGRISALREVIEYALKGNDVWFARRIDIARWWQQHSDGFA